VPTDMSTIRGHFWEVDLPSGWTAESDDACVTIQGPGRVGTLQISGAQKDVHVTDDDLRDFASDHLEAGARPVVAACGDYSGFSLRYGDDGTYWRHWYLRCSRSMIMATYNCSEEDREVEDAEVDRIVGTLRRRKDG
jgi:hypothetical protein